MRAHALVTALLGTALLAGCTGAGLYQPDDFDALAHGTLVPADLAPA